MKAIRLFSLFFVEWLTALIVGVLFLVSALCNCNGLGELSFWGWLYVFASTTLWTMAVVSPLLIFGGRFTSWFYCVLLSYLLLIDSILVFVRINFDMLLDGSWLAIALGTSKEELGFFISHYFGFTFFLLVVCFVLCLWGILRMKMLLKERCRFAKKKCAMGCFLLVFYCVAHPYVFANIFTSPARSVSSTAVFSLVLDTFQNWRMYEDLARAKENPEYPDGVCRVFADPCSVGVFVLGESATRNHMSVYGYERKTTPEFDKRRDALVAYADCVVSAPETGRSMRYILTQSEVEGKNEFNPVKCTYPQVLHLVGYRTTLFSRHKHLGRFCGIEAYAFAGCDEQVYLHDLGLQTPYYDEAILHFYSDELKKAAATNSVVFLHLWGSHTPQSSAYPHNKGRFEVVTQSRERRSRERDGEGVAHYDNSIAYTDEVLGQIVEELESLDVPAWLVYLSDHGETPCAKGWRVVSHRDLWEIPLVFWFNEKYRIAHPDVVKLVEKSKNKPLQSDQLFVGLLRIAGVKCAATEGVKDFLSPAFSPRHIRHICEGRNVYTWSSSQLGADR